MRKINKLAAAIAVAVGVGVTSTANAVIELKPNGRGDALLFPIYHGFFENYFTISNIANAWIQGHIRFRGAAWSGELRDFDVILSPGDVMVFRLADVDGDGEWEIDQTLDPKNFRYTGMFAEADMPFTCQDASGPIVGCMEKSNALIPSPNLVIQVNPTVTFGEAITQGVIDYQKHAGYVEFIGEAVLDGMTTPIMNALLNNASHPYQTRVFNKRGTTAWAWSDADGSYGPSSGNGSTAPWGDDMGLSDVPNALSGTAFITNPGWSHGLAYNAETLVNFRTATCDSDTGDNTSPAAGGVDACASYAGGEHRIDNYRVGTADNVAGYNTAGSVSGSDYETRRSTSAAAHPKTLLTVGGFNPLAENRAVIVHHENGIVANSSGDYVYWWNFADGETRCDEQSIAFNNTWGPTLADGDDYQMGDTFVNVANADGTTGGGKELPPTNSDNNNKWDRTGALNANGNPWNLRWTGCPFPTPIFNDAIDDFDCNWSVARNVKEVNSVAEVDESLRDAGQTFTAYYMDSDIFDKSGDPVGLQRNDGLASTGTLTTQFVSFFPTKFFHFEVGNVSGGCDFPNFPNLETLIANRALAMTRYPKLATVQVWDTEENPIGFQTNNQCISPATLAECFTATQNINFPFEVGVMGIDHVKNVIAPGIAGSSAGRVYFDLLGGSDKLTPTTLYPGAGVGSNGFVGLLYAFEWDGFPPSVIAHWRSMHR